MAHAFATLAFTPAVRAAQERYGSRAANQRLEAHGEPHDAIGAAEAAFIAERDSFYLATVSEEGWPYVQHRGGPAGFLRVLDAKTLAFADFGGNRQYVSVGNATANDRVSLFLMDYAHRERLKILGHLRMIDVREADEALRAAVALPGYRARIERVATITVAALSWNCPQHITPRFTLAEIERARAQPLEPG
jgi:uncharacterized protein